MSSLISKYTWLVDTIRRSRRISREELNRRWCAASVSNGAEMPRRTFYNYRQAVFDIFGVEILYDTASGEYYINESADSSPLGSGSVTDFLLNNAAMSGMLSDTKSISDRLFLEQVPSARHNLEPMIEAVKSNRLIKFNYHPFNRSRVSRGVVIEPYLLKLFRQRWYVAGRNVAERKIKTYALDRISEPEIQPETFEMSAKFNPKEYFRYSFGIVVDNSEPRIVKLRTDTHQAKYLRALPLHPSQQEEVHDDYSLFSYRLLLTPDFLRELMSLGPDVKIEEPAELQAMLKNRLRETLALYE